MRRFLWLLPCLALAQPPERLTLAEAEALAVQQQPQIRAAQFGLQATEQGIVDARSALYPTFFGSITGAGALDRSNLAAGALSSASIYNKFATGTTVNQLLTDFGRTSQLIASARLRAQADATNITATRAQVLLRVDRAYFAVLRTQSVLVIAERTVAARQVIADQVSELAKSNLKSGLDLSFANVNLAEAKLLLVSAQNERQASFAELSAALGYGEMRPFEVADPPAPPQILDPVTQYLQEARQQRPDLAVQQYNQESAARFAEAERKLRWPSISATGGVGFIPGHDDRLSGRYAAGGLNITLPILNGHLYTSRQVAAEARASASAANVEDLRQRIARDVQVAYLNAETARQRIGLTGELLQQANLALDLAQARYDLGLSAIVELSQAQLNKTAAEIQNTEARYDYQTRLAELNFQAGLLK